jgi:hypothetical protein
MKKVVGILAGVVLAAAVASAESLGWVGSSVAYANGTWYNCSGSWGSGGSFNGHSFGVLTELVIGGNVSTWWDNSASHPLSTAVYLGYNVDGTGDHLLALPWHDFGSNNDRWEQMSGVNVFAYLGAGTEHTVSIWFQATGNGNTLYDSNFSQNYTASFSTVPEPTAAALLGLGASWLAVRRRRRR